MSGAVRRHRRTAARALCKDPASRRALARPAVDRALVPSAPSRVGPVHAATTGAEIAWIEQFAHLELGARRAACRGDVDGTEAESRAAHCPRCRSGGGRRRGSGRDRHSARSLRQLLAQALEIVGRRGGTGGAASARPAGAGHRSTSRPLRRQRRRAAAAPRAPTTAYAAQAVAAV